MEKKLEGTALLEITLPMGASIAVRDLGVMQDSIGEITLVIAGQTIVLPVKVARANLPCPDGPFELSVTAHVNYEFIACTINERDTLRRRSKVTR